MMMHRWLSVSLAVLLGVMLCSCTSQSPQESASGEQSSVSSSEIEQNDSSEEKTSENSSEPVSESTSEPLLSIDEYPTVDGSTATMPLMAAVLQKVCGIDAEQAESYVYASKTSQSWLALSNGDADLLLVYEAPESTKEQLAAGPELEVTAIGRDALVFIVNEQNPIESLTQDQLRDIYTGTVTNWSELGGNDQSIVAFQRDETSGSQTLFEKLLVGDRDLTLMDPPTELRPGMMGALVDGLASYNNEGNAIGYSVYYYISEMYAQPGLKLIGVDGVQPEYDTIADNSYPLCNEFYVAIRADEPEDSPTRKLYNWICSDEGKQTLIDAGYVPAE